VTVSGVRAGAQVQAAALPDGERTRSDGSVSTNDVTASQDLVSKQTLHAQAPDDTPGGRQSPRPGRTRPANHVRPRPGHGRGVGDVRGGSEFD